MSCRDFIGVSPSFRSFVIVFRVTLLHVFTKCKVGPIDLLGLNTDRFQAEDRYLFKIHRQMGDRMKRCLNNSKKALTLPSEYRATREKCMQIKIKSSLQENATQAERGESPDFLLVGDTWYSPIFSSLCIPLHLTANQQRGL